MKSWIVLTAVALLAVTSTAVRAGTDMAAPKDDFAVDPSQGYWVQTAPPPSPYYPAPYYAGPPPYYYYGPYHHHYHGYGYGYGGPGVYIGLPGISFGFGGHHH